eukprot:Phypoly_transcript_18981.p1 GENE.Phypoly_transcript_18981~~Phypoly_transcript_18981.p1  ORF type:complete len:241 (+),score=22.09 Phypoly_transcript_18981:46-723(+)
MGELVVFQQAFYNPHQEPHREFVLVGSSRRFKQLPKGIVGNVIWDAGFVLSKYLESHYADKLRGTKAIEVGSGTGIAGITAGLLGAHVTLTDGFDSVLPLLSENVDSIFSESHSCSIPIVKKLEWGNEAQQNNILAEHGPFTYILCADLVYTKAAYEPLISTLRALCTPNITTILFAHKKRYDTEDLFFELASQYFVFTREPQSMLHDDYQTADIYLFHVTLKPS